MRQKTNKEEVYLINQPKHITSSIIILEDTFPLPEDIHTGIEKLCDISDVLFIYAPKYYMRQKHINFDKFASLYRSCAWIESGASLGSTLMKLLRYDKEIFGCHRNTLIWDFSSIGEVNTDKITSIIASPLTKPILEIERLGSEEFYEIYEECESIPLLNLLSPKKSSLEKAFCSYKATSDLVLLRENTIDTVLEFYDNTEDKFPHEYIESFTDPNIMYLLGSIIKYLGIDYFNANYLDIRL